MTTRSKEERREASIHVHYELRMLQETASKLAAGVEDYYLRCALLESFTIHARALHHFLWPKALHREDVLARHYVESKDWTAPDLPDGPASLADLRDDVNVFIAHISYVRPEPGKEKQWSHTAIATELRKHVHDWRDAVLRVDATLLDEKWKSRRYVAIVPGPPTSSSVSTSLSYTSSTTTDATITLVSDVATPSKGT